MSESFEQALKGALEAPRNIPVSELAGMLHCRDKKFIDDLFSAARKLSARRGKDKVLSRALIEVSNICSRDCLYCGIRKSANLRCRYSMSLDEMLCAADCAKRKGFTALAVQAGEIESEKNTRLFEDFLSKADFPEITLSLGEQTREVYQRWKIAAGKKVLRYLLRIETSNEKLFAKIHSKEASFEKRLNAIRTLKALGYITGSGVMIGLPFQNIGDLADDLVFFAAENLDMIGMGPYIPCADALLPSPRFSEEERLELSLKMIALTRLYLWDVNIVSSTALEALRRGAKEMALSAGANVVMPNFTDDRFRSHYELYPGKNEIV